MSLSDDASSRILDLIRSHQWTVTEQRERTKWKLGARKGSAGVLVVGHDREQCVRHLAEGCGVETETNLPIAATSSDAPRWISTAA